MILVKTNAIRQYIKSKLNELCNGVYYQDASNEASFPYVVYDLKSYNNGTSATYDFEVNIWGNGSQVDLEDLADGIESMFEKNLNLSENGLLTFKWLNRGNVDDPNKELKRIMIKFDMSYYN